MPLMRSVDEHRRVVADLITAQPPTPVPIADALGLILGADVVALPEPRIAAVTPSAICASVMPLGPAPRRARGLRGRGTCRNATTGASAPSEA